MKNAFYAVLLAVLPMSGQTERGNITGQIKDPSGASIAGAQVVATPTATHFGNATRFNPKLRSRPGRNENVSLAKSFRITESKRADVRGEAFNLFNRTQFGNPNTNLNAATFGVVASQANTARQMQAALKFYW